MVLSRDLAMRFAKATKDKEQPKKESVLYGTARVEGEGDSAKVFVQLDGSDIQTPASTTVEVDNGERVTVMMKNHNAVITGNITNPAARVISLTSLTVDINEDVEEAKYLANSAGNLAGQAMSSALAANSKATDAAKTALNYIHADSDGFILGEKTDDVLGKHLKLVPDGVFIQDGDVILARYYGENIDLGVSSDQACISFNGGEFLMFRDGGSTTLSATQHPLYIEGTHAASLSSTQGNTALSAPNGAINLNAVSGVNIKLPQWSSNNQGRLYLTYGDSMNVEWYGSGFVTNGGKDILFTIPLSRMVLGPTTISVTSVSGLKVRHANGGYSHGSDASVFAKPSSYTAQLNNSNLVLITATMSSTTNAVNNAPCGVSASVNIKIG